MNSEELIAKVGIYGASFVVGFVSGLVPFVNSELYLVAVSSMVARPALLPIALLSASGQMVAKTIIFYAGREDWENKADFLMLISASVGLPPFYVVSFVAGALKLHYIRFFIAGIIGRSIRFAAIVYFPQLVLKYI
jgi:membrane protein YqaA with SNARE-associated domain